MENMSFSKTELMILTELAKGNSSIKSIAIALKKSDKQIYRSSGKLVNKGLIMASRGVLTPLIATHTAMLLQLLMNHKNMINLLSGSGLDILISLPGNINDIIKNTRYKKSVIYSKLKKAEQMHAVVKKDEFSVNSRIWPDLKEFLDEYKIFTETTDPRVPLSSTIYYKDKDEIVFSSNQELDAQPTAFSMFENFGIKLFLTTRYYYLPKKSLSQKDILRHSLYIAKKEKSIRLFTYLALFYIKSSVRISDPLIKDFKRILNGEHLSNYPTLTELKDKAKIYNIKI